jgi:hypothetical protein
LRQEKEEALKKIWVVQQEKYDLWAKFEEDREQIRKEKYQLLTENIGIRKVVNRALLFVPGSAQMEEETTKIQVGNLAKVIQQLQARVAEL